MNTKSIRIALGRGMLPAALIASLLSARASLYAAPHGGGGGGRFGERGRSMEAEREVGRGMTFGPRSPESFSPQTAEPAARVEPLAEPQAGTRERQPSPERPVNTAPARAYIDQRAARLSADVINRGGETREGRMARDLRVERVRVFFYDLIDIGWPVDIIDTWFDALTEDEIVVGMPDQLVLDYWGEPSALESVEIRGVPEEVWTYRLPGGRTRRIEMAGGKVIRAGRV